MSEGAPKSVAQTGEEPTKIIEIGGKKFELGPNLGMMSWNDMNEKVEELNKVLKEGEKPWRVFSKDEYLELEKQADIICKVKGLSVAEESAKYKEFVTGLGFAPDEHYWSSTEYADRPTSAFGCRTINVFVGYAHKTNKFFVQCFREV